MRQFSMRIAWVAFLLASCERPELPVPPHDPGAVSTVQVEMGTDYRQQLFFDFGCNCVVASNLKTDWDLGFSSDDTDRRIRLNGARGMAIAATGLADFAAVTDTAGAAWRHDRPSGHRDSTAFGNFPATGEVFIVDRGYDHLGNHTGFRKLAVLSLDEDSSTIRYAELNGFGDTTLSFGREPGLNQTAFSFDRNGIVDIEPPSTEWDLCFTQYTHIFDDPPLAYLVTGVLINASVTAVAMETERDFAAISFDHVGDLSFSSAADIIGYNWKEFNFTANQYEVLSQLNYIVRDGEGRHYKLHFVDFYTQNGDKGAPKIEFQEL